MKKINSIHFGGKIIAFGASFLLPIPFLIVVLDYFFPSPTWKIIRSISITIGICIELFFLFMLIIELHQDKKREQYFAAHKNEKILLSSCKYECLNCGNKQVGEFDLECNICHIKFQSH